MENANFFIFTGDMGKNMMEKNRNALSKNAPKFNALNLPIHRASTLVFDSTEAFLSRKTQLFDGFSYGLYGTPTTKALEEQIARVEGGQRAVLVPSGLASLTLSMLAVLQGGDHVLVADCVYGPTREFCQTILKKMGIAVTFFEADAGSLHTLINEKTKLVVLESPGSFTMEIQDISIICEVAHAAHALVMMDNTWGFGNARMFDHGIDIVCTALSKYASGHSDVCMGSVTVNDEELYRKLKTFVTGSGIGVSSDDAYLVMRGLSTLEIRLAEHAKRGLELTRWLRARTEVKTVLNPADPDDAFFSRFDRYFASGNGLVSLILHDQNLDSISAMLDGLRYFRIGNSWGGTTSLVALGDLSSVRTAEPWPQGRYILRLHMGLEPVEQLYDDLEEGFARLTTKSMSMQGYAANPATNAV